MNPSSSLARGAGLALPLRVRSVVLQLLASLWWDTRRSTNRGGWSCERLAVRRRRQARWPAADLAKATVADATSHPNWSMGRKITVDSATLMNKGLEVIEAHYLFGLDDDHIEIVIHPQSIIHSMVELADSSVLAQLGWPDMKLPILYCLSWPERLNTPWRRLDLTEVGQLTFRAPDRAKYPCMSWPTPLGGRVARCRRP